MSNIIAGQLAVTDFLDTTVADSSDSVTPKRVGARVRCTATSKETKQQCKNYSYYGSLCNRHGGTSITSDVVSILWDKGPLTARQLQKHLKIPVERHAFSALLYDLKKTGALNYDSDAFTWSIG